eukprot:4380987-Prymnesium_polylepis.1
MAEPQPLQATASQLPARLGVGVDSVPCRHHARLQPLDAAAEQSRPCAGGHQHVLAALTAGLAAAAPSVRAARGSLD